MFLLIYYLKKIDICTVDKRKHFRFKDDAEILFSSERKEIILSKKIIFIYLFEEITELNIQKHSDTSDNFAPDWICSGIFICINISY